MLSCRNRVLSGSLAHLQSRDQPCPSRTLSGLSHSDIVRVPLSARLSSRFLEITFAPHSSVVPPCSGLCSGATTRPMVLLDHVQSIPRLSLSLALVSPDCEQLSYDARPRSLICFDQVALRNAYARPSSTRAARCEPEVPRFGPIHIAWSSAHVVHSGMNVSLFMM